MFLVKIFRIILITMVFISAYLPITINIDVFANLEIRQDLFKILADK
ncbi:MAG: hypothetical protein KKH08_06210 [Candidatus Omnitrophica bacterium]|nr:hypothetical protein [Candidatus Omnitrophota bacterium]